jgi:ribose/xylose/arabinose/galactoside ABC-type transport system permease subunit
MCGVLVAPITGLTGNQLAAIIVTLSILAMIVGLFLWVRSQRPLVGRPRELSYAMGVLSAALVVGTLFSLPGQWIPALLFGVIAILLAVVLLGSYLLGT